MNNLTESKTLHALLEIENDDDLIQFVCPETGVLIWPFIRIAAFRTIMSEWLFKSTPLIFPKNQRNNLKLVKNTTLSALHNFNHQKIKQKQVLIQSTGLGNYVRNELIYDRLIGYFAEALPNQTLIYQDKPKENWKTKYFFDNCLYKTPRNLINKIYSHLAINSTHRNLARRVIDRFVDSAYEKIGFKFNNYHTENLTSILATYLATFPYASDAYANWFSKQGFKLMLKEDACYGGDGISIIHAARLNNMVVAEYQHGAISKGHDGYNVCNKLVVNDLFKQVLPDYLLTYGNWWSKQTNMPINKVSIGNPHLTESLNRLRTKPSTSDKVLILGDGIETELYLHLASRISDVVKRYGNTVVFRPHPLEREKITNINLPSGVKIDTHADIYPSLLESHIVISELSTGLFEAVGLADKVLLWETEKSSFSFPEIPFDSFSTIEEFESILNSTSSNQDKHCVIPQSELWEPHWKHNYMSFIDSVISR